jgi:hypothetical protein
VHILIFAAFWNGRNNYFHCIDENGLVSASSRVAVTPTQIPIPNDDSDTSGSSVESEESEEENYEERTNDDFMPTVHLWDIIVGG